MRSSTPVIVTVCGAFQLALVKVSVAGDTVPSVRSLEVSPMLTVLPPGELFRTTVKVAVPPLSVVTRPEVGVTVMPAAKVPGHWLSSFVENGLLAAPLPKCSRDEASSTQSPPCPVRLFDANTRAFVSRAIRLMSNCPLPRQSIRLQPKRLMLPSRDMTSPRDSRSAAIPGRDDFDIHSRPSSNRPADPWERSDSERILQP